MRQIYFSRAGALLRSWRPAGCRGRIPLSARRLPRDRSTSHLACGANQLRADSSSAIGVLFVARIATATP